LPQDAAIEYTGVKNSQSRLFLCCAPAPVFHYLEPRAVLQHADVAERVAVDDDEICERSRSERTDAAGRVEREAAVSRRAQQRFRVRHAEQLDEVLEILRIRPVRRDADAIV